MYNYVIHEFNFTIVFFISIPIYIYISISSTQQQLRKELEQQRRLQQQSRLQQQQQQQTTTPPRTTTTPQPRLEPARPLRPPLVTETPRRGRFRPTTKKPIAVAQVRPPVQKSTKSSSAKNNIPRKGKQSRTQSGK